MSAKLPMGVATTYSVPVGWFWAAAAACAADKAESKLAFIKEVL